MTAPLPRRAVLLGAAAGALAAACGDDGGETATTSSSTAGAGDAQLIVNFPRGEPYAPPGIEQRLPFLLANADGSPMDRIDGPVTFTVSRRGTQVGEPVEVLPHAEDIPRSYLPLPFTFPEIGVFDVAARYRGAELGASVQIVERGAVLLPQVGEALPPVDTSTNADARGVTPLCTNDPVCPFHEVNLRDALAAAQPVLLLVSTPAYCQVAICGPVLDLLLDEAQGLTGLAVIHQEVYANAGAVASVAEADLAPLLEAYGMTFEPSLFAVDRRGTLVRRLDAIYDRAELREAMTAALA